jgi:hypothetical protein
MAKNDLKMPNFTMDFENYGYPSIKIGLFGNNGVLCQW